MGVIRKQGLWSTIYIYGGFLFGFVNTLILFPRLLTQEMYGLTTVLIDTAKFLSTISLFGSLSLIVKFFPFYKRNLEQRQIDLLKLTLIISLVGTGLTLFGIFWKTDWVIRKFGANSPLFTDYFYWVIPLFISMVLYNLMETYASVYRFTRIGALFREVGVRLFVSVTLVLVGMKVLGDQEFIAVYAMQYVPVFIALIVFLRVKKLLWIPSGFSIVTKKYRNKIFEFAIYMQGGIILSVAAITVDSIFIAAMGGLPKVATFTVGRYLSELVHAPYRAFSAISAPIISEAWKTKNLKLLQDIYVKSSINQLIAGVFAFSILWICFDPILIWLGNSFREARWVFFVLGLTRIVDLGAGLNAEILGTSSKWRFNFVAQSILIFLFIPINYVLLKEFSIVGSAFASLIAFVGYNLVRYVYLYRKFKLQPFTIQTLTPILLAGILLGAWEWFSSSDTGNAIVQSAIGAFVFALIFLGAILLLGTSPDLNVFVRQLKDKYLS